ncbi:putative baseplate tail tube initiator [Escherichia phage vB_EcoM_Skers]|uniref:Baseplate tail tube initiator n=6 Tax=Krischvirus TaxID=1913651 RepID=C4MZ06_9CAUD|nr:tail tube [Escherichia phage JSE]YP_010097206.1 tail tube [Escherichia virus KFS-EC]AUV63871.1 baseplate subunit [Shigella phage Sf20]EIF8777836.1 phage tail protein [Escherichia coli]QBQ74335.1 baseplate hub protein [Escherichia phage vB_EcoM_PHB13]QHB48780.1 baseplate tail tube initiator [Escherichia phage E26]QMP82505.1 baseplate tail tube initiator [Escherichia phage vB_EcoM_011D4]QXN69051.1 putative baseplate tail tube initiator [Escherichia phage vB_EcoM_Skers]
MFDLNDFNEQAANLDFQRSNLFSVAFATTPSNKTQAILESMGGAVYDIIPNALNDYFGITRGDYTDALTNLAVQGVRRAVDSSGVKKYLLGAMSSRVVQSLLGQFDVGTYALDWFNMAYKTSGLLVYAVKVPENRLNYEMDRNHNAPNIRITGRDFDPLVLSFRMDSSASNYRAMQDWVNSVEDPVTGLRALPVDVEADIQVNLHNRMGVPHTIMMFNGCVPVGVSAPELNYENNNEITTFDVTFAYRSMQTGAVGEQAAREWIEDKAINAITNTFGNNLLDSGLSAAGNALSRLNGVGGRVVNTVTNWF